MNEQKYAIQVLDDAINYLYRHLNSLPNWGTSEYYNIKTAIQILDHQLFLLTKDAR